ncbi:MAG: HAMP domain-containing histidine kinase [Chloroflexi bacterium]|nr:HAMP domain-containing histidine kinase [Chloroflexota bacterium]
MSIYEEHVSFLEFLYPKPNSTRSELTESLGNLAGLFVEVFNDLQRSRAGLHEQIASLQARNKELEAYAHMVAHDLKDPLTAIIVTSNLIAKIPNMTHKEMKEYLQQIGITALEMNKTINSLLLFAEVGKADAPVGTVHMAGVVANVLNRLKHLIQQQQTQIILPDVWPDCVGYGPWIEEVWANYLSNAFKHGGRPPLAELGVSTQSDGMLRFWIRDNGPGISPVDRAQLFTPFNQNGRAHFPGHGMGLPMTLCIVEKMGGRVGVESEVGQGSLFYFTLPPAQHPIRKAFSPR